MIKSISYSLLLFLSISILTHPVFAAGCVSDTDNITVLDKPGELCPDVSISVDTTCGATDKSESEAKKEAKNQCSADRSAMQSDNPPAEVVKNTDVIADCKHLCEAAGSHGGGSGDGMSSDSNAGCALQKITALITACEESGCAGDPSLCTSSYTYIVTCQCDPSLR